RELHDRIGQNLSALNLSLGLMRRHLPADSLEKMHGRFEDAQGLLESTVHQVRNVMADLRPAVLDDYGLAAALTAFAKPFGERLGIPITVYGELQPRPSIAVETALFRIAQEALNNVGKHARARNVAVRLETLPACLRLTVEDDGVGFDPVRPRADVRGDHHARARRGGRGRPAHRVAARPGHARRGRSRERAGMKTRVLLADDHGMMREGLRALLAGAPDIDVIADVGNGREAVRMAGELMPDVVVMDV